MCDVKPTFEACSLRYINDLVFGTGCNRTCNKFRPVLLTYGENGQGIVSSVNVRPHTFKGIKRKLENHVSNWQLIMDRTANCLTCSSVISMYQISSILMCTWKFKILDDPQKKCRTFSYSSFHISYFVRSAEFQINRVKQLNTVVISLLVEINCSNNIISEEIYCEFCVVNFQTS